MIKIVWKCISIIAISPKRGMEQAEIIDTFWTYQRTPSKRSKPSEPATSVQPEAPDNLLEALEGATIDEEHRTVMSMVVQRVQSAKSGLNEACASLLTGFQVSKKIC